MDPADLETIRTLLRDELSAPTITDRILTRAEAVAYTKHDSDSAFYRWCTRWRVTSSAPGRYARGTLDSALAREAARRRPAKSAPRRPVLNVPPGHGARAA